MAAGTTFVTSSLVEPKNSGFLMKETNVEVWRDLETTVHGLFLDPLGDRRLVSVLCWVWLAVE